jgi:hypothetical protein
MGPLSLGYIAVDVRLGSMRGSDRSDTLKPRSPSVYDQSAYQLSTSTLGKVWDLAVATGR